MMGNYIDRMNIELKELINKIEKCKLFTDTVIFSGLSVSHKDLLHKQIKHMNCYRKYLSLHCIDGGD